MADLEEKMRSLEAAGRGRIRVFPWESFAVRVDGVRFTRLKAMMSECRRRRGDTGPSPFDGRFKKAMTETSRDAVNRFAAVCAYTQSDECTLLFAAPYATEEEHRVALVQGKDHLWRGRVAKLLSVVPSYFACRFARHLTNPTGGPDALGGCDADCPFRKFAEDPDVAFDARIVVFEGRSTGPTGPPGQDANVQAETAVAKTEEPGAFDRKSPEGGDGDRGSELEGVTEVSGWETATEYVRWRQLDCHRNAVSGLAQALLSARQTKGFKDREMKEMMASVGYDFDRDTSDDVKWGTVVRRRSRKAVFPDRSCPASSKDLFGSPSEGPKN